MATAEHFDEKVVYHSLLLFIIIYYYLLLFIIIIIIYYYYSLLFIIIIYYSCAILVDPEHRSDWCNNCLYLKKIKLCNISKEKMDCGLW